jgi:hypothetical protein
MAEANIFKIESNDLTISQILKDFYTVPDFQREYVWEREQVEKLLQDILDEFYDENGKIIEGPEYFLGSVVACKDKTDSIYQLIDGQQRLTTIYLILCAAREALKEAGEEPTRVLLGQISDVYADAKTGEDVERQRLTLQYEDSDGIIEKIVTSPQDINSLPETTRSVKKILAAYRDIRDFFRINLQNDPGRIKKFLVAFMNRIKLIRILTPNIANALKVFETINDRGVGLNAMDLLKNLLFIKTDNWGYPKLKERWKKLIDTLDRCQEKPLRFLRYYIMAHYQIDYHRGIREDEIYQWFVNNTTACGIDTDPISFANELINCAEAYAYFSESKNPQGVANQYLRNLALLGGALRQHYILLLAGRNLPVPLFDRLCRAIENLLFCYIITREQSKTLERNFARWALELSDIRDEQTLDMFLGKNTTPEMAKRNSPFDFAFSELNQVSIQQYRMRYILAKLTQFIEENAWGNPKFTDLDGYMDSSVHVEHILPQQPEEDVLNDFDKPAEYHDYKIKLGNLTLLEKTINTSISNRGYGEKRPGYLQSSFLLTKSLVEKPHVGSNTQLNRAVQDLIQFAVWDSSSIEKRQKMLAGIARKTWGMPGAD